MSKRKKSASAIKGKVDGALLSVERTLQKKHFQPGEEQNGDTVEAECKTMTERQGTEDIAMKPGEDEEPVTISHNIECKRQRTELIVPAVEEKDCRVNGSQEEEHLSLPLSQNSAGKYVPVFQKPKNQRCRRDSWKNSIVNTNKESSNIIKTEGDDRSHNVVLECSEFCQVQIFQQTTEQVAFQSSHLDSEVSKDEQQETLADKDCVQQGSSNCVSLSGIQLGTDFMDRAGEGLACYSDPIKSAVNEVRNKSSTLDNLQCEMGVLCSTPIPVAHNTVLEPPLTQSELKTLTLSSCFSDAEPNNELMHHSFYQEIIDKVPVTPEELAVSQREPAEHSTATKENADNVEDSVQTPGVLMDFSYREKTPNVVCEKMKVKLFVQMNLSTDLFAQSDTKETCSQPADLSLDTNAENQRGNYHFNSQSNKIDEHRNVNGKLPESSNSTKYRALKNDNDCQKSSNGNCSDSVNITSQSTTDNIILCKDTSGEDTNFQQQPNQCFSDVKRMDIESKLHPDDQAEKDITQNQYQKIVQNPCETGEETKEQILEALSENYGNGAFSTDSADQKYNTLAHYQGSFGERCNGPEFIETQLTNSALIDLQTDTSESLVCSRNSCISEPDSHLETNNIEPQLLETNINPLQTVVCPVKNEVIPDIEVNCHEIHFSSKCNAKGTESAKELMTVNKMSFNTNKGTKCNKLASVDNLGFQTESHMADIEASRNLNGKEFEQKVNIKVRSEDTVAALQLSSKRMEDDTDSCQQEEKVNKQVPDGGNVESGVVNNDYKEFGVEEQAMHSSTGHPKEEGNGNRSDQTVFSVDLQLRCDLATRDESTLPRGDPNVTTVSVVSSQYQLDRFIARHGGLSTSSVETADGSSVHRKPNTETDHNISNVDECKDYSLSMVDEKSSRDQEKNNAQCTSASWTVDQNDKNEQNSCPTTNCETFFKPIQDKMIKIVNYNSLNQ
ncbi:uncharacterized protein [Narcine bancroftii]|uniref:uncharacterized protein isoform X2 n=1 Tax=Narcine bancroftii TaxID=1343680 RepID=UPI0038318236